MPTAIRADTERTRGFLLYFAGLATVGVVIIGASVAMGWGFLGYGLGGFLLLAGGGGAAGMAMGGGTWVADCPSCGLPIRPADGAVQKDMDKLMACEACGTWVHGKHELDVVPDDYEHGEPGFYTPLPKDGFRWPEGCARCGEAVAKEVEVTGISAIGATTTMVTGGINKVVKITVPVCGAHTDQPVWVTRDGGERIWFHRIERWRAFRELNGTGD